jgi:predicted MFS family arabinose efflux permease
MSEGRAIKPAGPISLLTVSRLIINIGLRLVYPFLPAFARGLGVPLLAVAAVVSLRGFASLLSPIFGPLSEKYGRRRIMSVSMLIFGAGNAIVIIWPELWAFALTLSIIAVAKVIYDPAMQAYIGDKVAYEKRGRYLAITELSWAGAFILGIPVVGYLIQQRGWQAPFVALGIAGLVAAPILWRFLPKADGRPGIVTNLGATWQLLRRQPVIWAAALYVLLAMIANEIILIVYGDWMEISFALSLTTLGLATSIIGGAELIGELLTAIVVDRIGKRPFIILTGLVTTMLYFLLPRTSTSLTTALISLFVLFLFFEMTVVGGVPLMTELVPSARSIVLSVVLAAAGVGRGLGALLGPILWAQGNFNLLGSVAALIMFVAMIILAAWVREGDAEPTV